MRSFFVVTYLLFAGLPALSQCPKTATRCVTIVRHEQNGTYSSTRFDNDSHARAVADATTAITEASLNFLFVEWPELQRLHNERLNRSEGQFSPLYEKLDLLVAIPVDQDLQAPSTAAATLKSHRLGESWPGFLQTASVLASNVEKCRQKRRPKENATHTKFIPCSVVWPLIDNQAGTFTFDCLSVAHFASKDVLCRDFDGEVSFSAGQLSSIKVAIADDWPHVYKELCERFGPPSAADAGDVFAIWNTPTFHLVAYGTPDIVGVSWMDEQSFQRTSAWAKQIVSSQKQSTNGNSLD